MTEILSAAQYREQIAADHAQVWRKYRNKPTRLDGIRFASKKEANRHAELLLLQRAGKIELLERQVPFKMIVNGQLICTYIADWTYIEGGKVIGEDAKGVQTEAFRLKWKLAKALYSQITWRLS